MSVPFPDPVAEIIPEHSTEDRTDDREGKMISRPESSDEDHHIHPWDGCPDDREWLDACRSKSNQIVPISHCLNQFSHPVDRNLDPFRMNERDDEDTKCQKREEDGESLRNKWKRFSKHEKEDYDASRVWKKMAIAKGKLGNWKRKYWQKNLVAYIKWYYFYNLVQSMSIESWKRRESEIVANAKAWKPIAWLLLIIAISSYGLSDTVRNKVDGIVGSLPQSTVDLIHKSGEELAQLLSSEDN